MVGHSYQDVHGELISQLPVHGGVRVKRRSRTYRLLSIQVPCITSNVNQKMDGESKNVAFTAFHVDPCSSAVPVRELNDLLLSDSQFTFQAKLST